MNRRSLTNQLGLLFTAKLAFYTLFVALFALPGALRAQNSQSPEKTTLHPASQAQMQQMIDGLENSRYTGDYPPTWREPLNTGYVHGMLIWPQANPRINDIPLEEGDFIGGFYQDDNGDYQCGGAFPWDPEQGIVFPLFGDDPDTPEKDGFGYAENIQFRFFSWTTMKDYLVDQVQYFDTLAYVTNNKWYKSGISIVLDIQAQENMDFYINASANPICFGDQLVLSGEEFIGSGGPYTFDWTSDPPGFNYNTQYPPATTPDQTTTYHLVVHDGALISEHDLTVIVNENPVANAGSNGQVCGNGSYQLNGSAENFTSVMWTTTGNGTFDDPTKLDAVYTPGTLDNQMGQVQLTLQVAPLNPCLSATSDAMTLTLIPMPAVDPGNDISACGTDPVVLDANAQNYGSILWTTDGDGSFTNPNGETTQYIPAGNDIDDGVTITVCVEAASPCEASACESLNISYLQGPYANAPSSRTRCEDQTVSIPASVSNNSGILWTTDGDGYFTNPNTIPGEYNPGPQDRANGGTTVTLHALPLSPCQNDATKDVSIILQKLPEVVTFGPNTNYVCGNGYLQLNAEVENYHSIVWETNGDGTFSSTTTLSTRYYPGPADVAAGNFELELVMNAKIPCVGSVSEPLQVEIVGNPTVDITTASGQHVCQTEGITLNAEADDYGDIEWTTSGDGSFSDVSSPNPTYTPGIEDVSSSNPVLLTITVAPIAPCEVPAEDQINVYFDPAPTANAGNDITACGGSALSGSAANQSSVLWTTSGDGEFDNATSLQPVYTPGAQDIANQMVTLTLTAEPVAPCAVAVSDNVVYHIDGPQISVDNVTSQEASAGGNVSLEFIASSTSTGTYTWYKDGEEIVGATASTLDINNIAPEDAGYYQAIYTNACGEVESNIALIEVLQASTQQIAIPEGWSGISSFITPENPGVSDVFSSIADQVIVVANNSGFYFPGSNTNTLGDWSVAKGYKIKMSSSQSLFMNGDIRYPAQSLTIPAGWSYLPVNTTCAVNIEDVFGSIPGIVMIKEIAATGVYWPGMNINTLQELYPGMAYQIYNNGPSTDVKYPTCDMPLLAPKTTTANETINHPWNAVDQTPANHTFGFTATAMSEFRNGDVIGIFTPDNVCAGVMMVNDNTNPAALTAFADDALTAGTNGFETGDAVSFRIYRASTNQEYSMDVVYAANAAEEFTEGGMSVIEDVNYMATAINEGPAVGQAGLQVYPNPTSGNITLDITSGKAVEGKLIVSNANGQTILEQPLNIRSGSMQTSINLNGNPRGVYYLRVVSAAFTKVEKVILK